MISESPDPGLRAYLHGRIKEESPMYEMPLLLAMLSATIRIAPRDLEGLPERPPLEGVVWEVVDTDEVQFQFDLEEEQSNDGY